MMQIDHRFEENLTPERIEEILTHAAAEPADHHGAPPAGGAAG
jgi:hypothetical protein